MKIRMRYYLRPLIFSFFIGISTFIFFYILDDIACQKIAPKLASSIVNLSITFSFTIIAFSLASFSLLQLIQDKDWFIVVSESKPYKSFLKRLFFSIVSTLFQFLFSLISTFILEIANLNISIIICIFNIMFMGYILFWVFDCLIDYIKILE